MRGSARLVGCLLAWGCSEGAMHAESGPAGAPATLDSGAPGDGGARRDARSPAERPPPDALAPLDAADPTLPEAARPDDASRTLVDARPADATRAFDVAPPADAGPGPENPPLADAAQTPDGPPVPDAVVPPACPFAAGSEPQKKVVFVDRYPAEDLDIEDELIRLFDAAAPGSSVRIGLYTWTRTRLAEAVVAAAGRDVDVRVVLDEDNQQEDPPGSGRWRYTRAIERLVQGLGADRVTLCNARTPPDGGGCHGPGINHNKFFLFSRLCDGSTNVVVQSSANLTNPQTTLYNNMVVIRGDAALFTAYQGYWDDLEDERARPDYYRSADGDTGTKAYFFPRAGETSSSDTIHNILTDNVECAPGRGDEIRVMMAWWTQARGYLIDDLRRLSAAGCDVRVLIDASASSAALREHARDALGGRVRIVEGIHSKYLLLDTGYLGRRRRLLWTGSHNYTGPALRENDETLLRIDDADVWDAFRANWQRAWDTLDR